VRSSLSENILSLCPIIGEPASVQYILPIFLMLLRDESSEVRLNLFKRLDDLNQVIGIEKLETSLIPSLEELAKERNWRLKL
jgi:serine/threonine-protein phosphatase 2A regulatory subunit A